MKRYSLNEIRVLRLLSAFGPVALFVLALFSSQFSWAQQDRVVRRRFLVDRTRYFLGFESKAIHRVAYRFGRESRRPEVVLTIGTANSEGSDSYERTLRPSRLRFMASSSGTEGSGQVIYGVDGQNVVCAEVSGDQISPTENCSFSSLTGVSTERDEAGREGPRYWFDVYLDVLVR